ncbi:MAG: hypothetical protein ACOY9Y_12475 [Bacillota bacterium]
MLIHELEDEVRRLKFEVTDLKTRLKKLEENLPGNNRFGGHFGDYEEERLINYEARAEDIRFPNADDIYEIGHS